jgi:hypothetical protein
MSNKKFFGGPDATRAIFQKSPLAAGGKSRYGRPQRLMTEPLHAFVGAGLRACPKIYILGDFDASLRHRH